MKVTGEGSLHYEFVRGLYRLVVDVDPGIVEYYRALVPRHVRINRQKYTPHISVVREEVLPNPAPWSAHEGQVLVFDYSIAVKNNDVYYWLEVYSDRLGDVRDELGLTRGCWYTWPPDGADCFHCTLGNKKNGG